MRPSFSYVENDLSPVNVHLHVCTCTYMNAVLERISTTEHCISGFWIEYVSVFHRCSEVLSAFFKLAGYDLLYMLRNIGGEFYLAVWWLSSQSAKFNYTKDMAMGIYVHVADLVETPWLQYLHGPAYAKMAVLQCAKLKFANLKKTFRKFK